MHSFSELSSNSPSFPQKRGIRPGCPLSPYLFIIVLSALTSDLNSFFQDIFSYTPWTYSSSHHLLMLNTQMTLFSLHELMTLSPASFISNTLPLVLDSSSTAPNAN